MSLAISNIKAPTGVDVAAFSSFANLGIFDKDVIPALANGYVNKSSPII
jgi:hypothetical protein